MNGTGADTAIFEPDSPTERAMLVTVLYRLEGQPEVGENRFTDVADGKWYTNAIAWAAENGIVLGRDETTFDPYANISREAWRWSEIGGDADAFFTDDGIKRQDVCRRSVRQGKTIDALKARTHTAKTKCTKKHGILLKKT